MCHRVAGASKLSKPRNTTSCPCLLVIFDEVVVFLLVNTWFMLAIND
jgi:hypothetical protein